MISNKEEKTYLRSIRRGLQIPPKNKREYTHIIQQQLNELRESKPNASIDDVYRELGTPADLVQSYESRKDFERLKRKYRLTKVFCIVGLAIVTVAIFAIVLSIIVIHDSINGRVTYFVQEPPVQVSSDIPLDDNKII